EFPKLSPDLQQYLQDRLKELETYRDYKERLAQMRAPAEARSVEELKELEWRQTEAVVLREKWLDDIKALRRAAADVEEWYRQLTQRGNRLLLFADRS